MYYGQRLSELMPYTWIVKLPVISDFRVSARFTELGVLLLAILSGYGVQQAWKGRPALRALVVGLIAFAVLEAGWPDGGRTKVLVPFDYSRLYAPVIADKTRDLVVDVPYGLTTGYWLWGNMPIGLEDEIYATEHGHPIAGGFVTRLSPKRLGIAVGHRFLTDLIALEGTTVPQVAAVPPPNVTLGAADARAMNVRWVVVWPNANRAVLLYLKRVGFRQVRTQNGVLLLERRTRS